MAARGRGAAVVLAAPGAATGPVVAGGREGATVERALARLRAGVRPGAILVLHDGAERGDRRPIAPAVLPRLLDELEARGLRSVPLDDLLGEAPANFAPQGSEKLYR